MRYYVSVPKNVARAIKRYPANDRAAIFHAIENLEGDPRPPGCAKLRVSDLGEYRTKVRGYRIRYDVDDQEKVVYILAVKSRGWKPTDNMGRQERHGARHRIQTE